MNNGLVDEDTNNIIPYMVVAGLVVVVVLLVAGLFMPKPDWIF